VRVPLWEADQSREHPLKIISGELNGVMLDPAAPEIRVGPGALVTGFVSVEYTSSFADATIWFGATSTWGHPRTSFTSFGALSTPARRRSRTERIQFTAAAKPGRYYYLLMWGPEPSAQYLFSATNWTTGTPRWDDGNKVANTPAPVIEQAIKSGWLPVRVYKDHEGVRGNFVQPEAIAAIRVTVDSAFHSAPRALNRSTSARKPRVSSSGGTQPAP
jgi:hypothetical protein